MNSSSSGGSTFRLAQKLQFERRSRIISEVAEAYEAYFQTYFKYDRHLGGLSEIIDRRGLDLVARDSATQ